MTEAKPRQLKINLYPYRSLSSLGVKVVLGIVVAANLAMAIFFWTLDAWPVFGFLGLDVALIFAAFAVNIKSANRSEHIIVEGDEVTWLSGAKRRTFNRRWLRVDLEFDEARELVGRLFLVSHGKRTEVGSFLGPEERRSLAKELRTAFAGTA